MSLFSLFFRQSPDSVMISIKTWGKQPRSGQWVWTIWQWCGGHLLSSHNSGLRTLRNDPAAERGRDKERIDWEWERKTVHSIVLLLHLLQTKIRRILPSTRVFVVLLAAVNTGHWNRTLNPDGVRRERKAASWEERLIPWRIAFQQLCVLYHSPYSICFFFWFEALYLLARPLRSTGARLTWPEFMYLPKNKPENLQLFQSRRESSKGKGLNKNLQAFKSSRRQEPDERAKVITVSLSLREAKLLICTFPCCYGDTRLGASLNNS